MPAHAGNAQPFAEIVKRRVAQVRERQRKAAFRQQLVLGEIRACEHLPNRPQPEARHDPMEFACRGDLLEMT